MKHFFIYLLFVSRLGFGQSKAPIAVEPAKPVELIVFSDFQCPFCARFAQPVREFQTKGVEGVETKVTFKNFPLGFHADAQLAAQAVEAAGAQRKFWEMHDLLFANQSALKREDLLRYADKLELDIKRFTTDLDGEGGKQRIAADLEEGQKRGVQGTPTFFVNGKTYSGTHSFDQLKDIVLAEQRRARALSEIGADLMSRGAKDAPVTLEFFADLTSPVSIPAVAVLDRLMERYPSRLRMQFRNFPLAFHPQAGLAHEAAMNAALAGHFWEVANYLLQHQESLREQDLIAYAGRLGMDENQLATNIQKHTYTPRVEADVTEGLNRGVRGSPVIFVNKQRIDGVPSLETLIGYVEAELKADKPAAPKGQ